VKKSERALSEVSKIPKLLICFLIVPRWQKIQGSARMGLAVPSKS